MRTAWIFAGQGSEEPGMGLALAARSEAASAYLAEASRVTGLDIPRSLERGARALTRTEVLQPVLVAVGLASACLMRDLPDFVAGHSLGELTAACWAADLDPSVALDLAAFRGQAMADAAASHPGGMVACRGVARAELEMLLERGRERGEICVAALNTPDEIVVSGDRGALDWVLGQLGARGTALRVAGSWHSARMTPAVAPFRARLDAALEGRSLRARFVSACRGREVGTEDLAKTLAEGISAPVCFLDAVRWMESAGVTRAYLPEPSRTTLALLRRASSQTWEVTT